MLLITALFVADKVFEIGGRACYLIQLRRKKQGKNRGLPAEEAKRRGDSVEMLWPLIRDPGADFFQPGCSRYIQRCGCTAWWH